MYVLLLRREVLRVWQGGIFDVSREAWGIASVEGFVILANLTKSQNVDSAL